MTDIDRKVQTEQVYDVAWQRQGDDEILECTGVTAQEMAKRLAAAVRNYGSVTIVNVVPIVRIGRGTSLEAHLARLEVRVADLETVVGTERTT